MSERALHADLKTSLLAEDSFLYAHLIKFERAVSTEQSKPARNPRDYVYISDASIDIPFDDASKNVQGNSNGIQTYRANRVSKVGSISETTEAKANSLALEINSTLLGATSPATANITITYSGTSIGSVVSFLINGSFPGWEDSGFLIGDKVCIKKSGHAFHNNRAIVTSVSTDGMTLVCEALDAGSTTNSTTSTFSINNAADEYESLFYEEYEGTAENGAYAGYINREVFIYKAHIKPDTGALIGAPYLIFKGIIAKAKITEDPGKSSKMTWSLTSHWGDFVRVNGRITADSEHRAIASDGKVDIEALRRFEYGADYGFMHSEKAINMIAVYKATETRTKLKSSGWLFKKYRQVEYSVEVDREVDLRFNLDAKYLPLIYGVSRTDSIPIFADTLKSDSSEIYVIYAICEGEVGGIYDIYIDDQSRICTDKNDFEARGPEGADTVEVPCEGRMDRGDTLSSETASSLTGTYWKAIDAALNFNGADFMGANAAMRLMASYRPAPPGNENPINDAGGVTHEMRTTMESPIDASFVFHAGRKHQRADDLMVSIADKTQFADGESGDLNQGFKLQDGAENEDNYWGPQHLLLDTAYAVAKYKVSDGETEIPEVDFVVRGREIEQYNYDYSYEQHPNATYTSPKTQTSQLASFNIGDIVDAYDPLNSSAALIQNLTVMDKYVYKTARNESITKLRFDRAPFSGDTIKTFYIVKDGQAANSTDKLTFATWDYLNDSGTLSGIVSESVGTNVNTDVVITNTTGDGGGIDIQLPAGDLRDVLNHVGTTGAAIIGFVPAGSTPATPGIEKSLLYIQPGPYDSTTNLKLENIGYTQTSESKPTSGTLMILNAAKLPSGSSSVDDYYKNQEIVITRTLSDGSIDRQTQRIIKYDGGTRTALFGDVTQQAIKVATVFVDYGTNNSCTGVVGSNESATIEYVGPNAAAAVAAIQTELTAGKVISPANPASGYLEYHRIDVGTRVLSTSGATVTYNKVIKVNPSFVVQHTIQQADTELYQPGVGEFIPNSSDAYFIGSHGDRKVSINPAIQLLDYLTDDRYGRGLDVTDDINLSSFMQAARDCDTRSDITIQANVGQNTFIAGDVYEYKVGTRVFWRGTIKTVDVVTAAISNTSYQMVTFKDCIGKLITKHADWKVYEEGQLIWKRHPAVGSSPEKMITHKVTSSDAAFATYTIGVSLAPQNFPLAPAGDAMATKVRLTRVGTGSGPSQLDAFSGGHEGLARFASADGNPLIKGFDAATGTFTNSGYSLYDSDEVKYWRYMGWQSHNQSEVTRHQTNATLRTETPVFDNVNNMLKHFNGVLRFSDGKYDLVVEQALDADSTWTSDDIRKIDEGDIIGAISLDDAGLKGSANSVGVTIPDPAIRYDNRSVTFFNSDYLKQDRGVPKKKDIKTPLISNYFNARMNAEQYLVQSRSNKKINFKIGPKGALLLAGELIKVTYPRFGFSEKVFRISNLSFTPDCLTQVTAIEHDDKSYKIGAKRANNINDSSQGSGAVPIPVVPPAPPIALTAVGGVEKVTLTWTNSVSAGEAWKTELLRNTSNSIPATVLQTFDIDKLEHEDIEVTGGQTYYYWVRHVKTKVTRQGRTIKTKSTTFPTVNGRAATPSPSLVKNQGQATLYYNSTLLTEAAFTSASLLPSSITGFPTITYNFLSSSITGVSSGSITNDQIGTTGWYRKPQPRTAGQNTFGVFATANGIGDTDTIGPSEWVDLHIPIPKVPESEPISTSGTNLQHTFIMNDLGTVSNNFSCAFNVNKGNQVYTFASSGTAANTFGILKITDNSSTPTSPSGGITMGEVNISNTGVISIAATANIIDTFSVESASFRVELFDRGNNDTDIIQYTITLRKESRSTRDGVSIDLAMNSAQATAFKGTLTNAVAQAVATAVIATGVRACPTAGTKRIVPNDKITVTNGDIQATRVFTGGSSGAAFASGQTGSIQASDFSSVVTKRFEGSVIVDNTLSAASLISNTTTSNQVNVGSVLKLGTSDGSGTLANSKFFTHGKQSFTDTGAGFFMDGSGRVNIGDQTNFMKFDGSSFSFAGQFSVTNPGPPGGPGGPGPNGINTATVSLYRVATSSSTSPGSFTGTFNYTFSSKALTGGTFNGWTTTIPTVAAGSFLWLRDAVVSTTASNINIHHSTFNAARVVSASGASGGPGGPGPDGPDGQSVKTVYLFKKNDSSLSSTTGGTFASPGAGNTDWSTTQPALTANNDQVYQASRTFTSDGLTPQQSSWSGPVVVARRTDGVDITTSTPAMRVLIKATSAAPTPAEFLTLAGRAAVTNDAILVRRSDGADAKAYVYSSGAWVQSTLFDGDMVVTGTIGADAITANAINAAKLEISGNAAGASRIFFDGPNNRIDIYDSSASVPRVRIGQL